MRENFRKLFTVASFTMLAIFTMGNESCFNNVSTSHDSTHTTSTAPAPVCIDLDGDGYGTDCSAGADCDDSLETGESCHAGCGTFSYDNDGDGYGNAMTTTVQCFGLPDQIEEISDCDDFSPLAAMTFPGAATLDSATACMRDLDGDGYGPAEVEDFVDPGTDCDDGFSTIHQDCNLAHLPADCFDMGDSHDEGETSELPVHSVCLSAFTMDVHEVTTAEYEACVFAGACEAPLDPTSRTRDYYYGNPEFALHPVINVNWFDAAAYCAWTGGRLPTEAEWEFAAEGGLGNIRFPHGDEVNGGEANFDNIVGETATIGSYAPNGYGLRDMAGNVWEWTNDYYDSAYFSVSPEENPTGPESGFHRAIKGGGYSSFNYYARIAYRNHIYETLWLDSLGFRCAR
jgi:Sulfatase-modifying factor enzyme 1